MSLKFLAVGQTFGGVRSDKSPFAMRKQNQLPSFPALPRYKQAEPSMVQTDWLESSKPAKPAPENPPEGCFPARSQPAPRAEVSTAKRGWFSLFKWFRTGTPRSDLIQSELSLDKVQPVRNDLNNSDLHLVLKRKKKKPLFASTQENNSLVRQTWSELTARLFDIGQK
jgi:hypothetical protein